MWALLGGPDTGVTRAVARWRDRVGLRQRGKRAVWPLVGGLVVIVGPYHQGGFCCPCPQCWPRGTVPGDSWPCSGPSGPARGYLGYSGSELGCCGRPEG